MSGHITSNEKEKSERFMTLITGLMECVEVMAEHAPEGEYLKAMNLFKDLYELKPKNEKNPPPQNPTIIYMMRDVIGNNPVVRQHDRRTRMRIKKNNKLRTDAEKLAAGWKVCEICDRIIAKGGMKEHQMMDVCDRTEDSKILARQVELEDTGRYFALQTKIKYALQKVGRKSLFNAERDSGYWLKGTYEERQAEEVQ